MAQRFKKFSTYKETLSFTVVFTRTLHGLYPEPHQTSHYHHMIHLPTAKSSQWSFSLTFELKPYMPSSSPHVCHILCPPPPPWLVNYNSVWRRDKLWSSLLCSFHQSFIQLQSKYSPQNLVFNLRLFSFPYFKGQISHAYRFTGKIIDSNILIFPFLYSKQKWKKWMLASVNKIHFHVNFSLNWIFIC